MSPSLPPPSPRATRVSETATILIGFSLPISASIDNLLLLVLLVAWLSCGAWQLKRENLANSPVSRVMLVFLLLAALGTTWGLGSTGERLRFFSKYAILLLPLCLIALPMAAEQKRRAAFAFGAGVLLTVLLSYAIKAGATFPGWLVPPRDPSEPVVFKLRITHSFFVALGAFLFFVAASHCRDLRWRWGLWAAAALAVGNLLIVPGRTGHLALLVLAGYLFIHRFRWRGAAVAALLIAVAGLVVSQATDHPSIARYSEGIKEIRNWEYGRYDVTSMGIRMQYAATSLRIIADHPLSGVGTGGFEHAYREKTAGTEAFPSDNPHNQYLLTAAQLGLPGLAILLAMFVVLWRAASRLPPAEQTLARGLLLAYAVANLFNSFLLDHTEKLLFGWAIGLLYSGLSRRSNGDARAAGA